MITICLTIVIVATIIAATVVVCSINRKDEHVAETKHKSTYKSMQQLNSLLLEYINEINNAETQKMFITTDVHKDHFITLQNIVISAIHND